MFRVRAVPIQRFGSSLRWATRSASASCFLFKRPVAVTAETIRTFSALTSSAPTFCSVNCGVRHFSLSTPKFNKLNNQLAGYNGLVERPEQEEEEQDPYAHMSEDPGYLPFPKPFHTINIVGLLLLANVLIYIIMNFVADDDWRDWFVEHFTCSHINWHRIYPLFTNTFYQENFLQLAIDAWLLWQFGNTILTFLGGARMLLFWAMTAAGGSFLHVGRQYFELHYGVDILDVRGRCFGPNAFILGLVGVEGLIYRHLNFMQNPPIPFLLLTAFVMVIDVWRIFTTKPEEHGAPTGGALVAYLFWALPTRLYGLDKLTAAM